MNSDDDYAVTVHKRHVAELIASGGAADWCAYDTVSRSPTTYSLNR